MKAKKIIFGAAAMLALMAGKPAAAQVSDKKTQKTERGAEKHIDPNDWPRPLMNAGYPNPPRKNAKSGESRWLSSGKLISDIQECDGKKIGVYWYLNNMKKVRGKNGKMQPRLSLLFVDVNSYAKHFGAAGNYGIIVRGGRRFIVNWDANIIGLLDANYQIAEMILLVPEKKTAKNPRPQVRVFCLETNQKGEIDLGALLGSYEYPADNYFQEFSSEQIYKYAKMMIEYSKTFQFAPLSVRRHLSFNRISR